MLIAHIDLELWLVLAQTGDTAYVNGYFASALHGDAAAAAQPGVPATNSAFNSESAKQMRATPR